MKPISTERAPALLVDVLVALGLTEPLVVTVPRGRYGALKSSMQIPQQLMGPIEKGQKIGTVNVTLDGKPVAQAPLVALGAVERAGFFKRLWDDLLLWWKSV